MLNEQERQLVKRAFAQGPAILLESGFTRETAIAFFERIDVKEEFALLEREFQNQDTIKARTKFISRRDLARLAGGATAVLARALAGPQYVRDGTNKILRDAKGHPILVDPGADAVQLRAAEQVLDRLGVVSDVEIEKGGDTSPTAFLGPVKADALAFSNDPNVDPKEHALRRERIRNAILSIAGEVPAIIAKFNKATGLGPKKKPTTGKLTKPVDTASIKKP